MALSAYAIGKKVWIVETDLMGEPDPPATLPVGSIVLTRHDALILADQLKFAADKAERQPAAGKAKDASTA